MDEQQDFHCMLEGQEKPSMHVSCHVILVAMYSSCVQLEMHSRVFNIILKGSEDGLLKGTSHG